MGQLDGKVAIVTGAGGGLGLTYGDTIGDLTLSTSGGVIGSLIGVYWLGALRGVSRE